MSETEWEEFLAEATTDDFYAYEEDNDENYGDFDWVPDLC